jgi:hypothetical protein
MAGAEFEGAFADARRVARASWLLERIAATGTLVMRKLGGGRAGELAIHRLLSQPEVTGRRRSMSPRRAPPIGAVAGGLSSPRTPPRSTLPAAIGGGAVSARPATE